MTGGKSGCIRLNCLAGASRLPTVAWAWCFVKNLCTKPVFQHRPPLRIRERQVLFILRPWSFHKNTMVFLVRHHGDLPKTPWCLSENTVVFLSKAVEISQNCTAVLCTSWLS